MKKKAMKHSDAAADKKLIKQVVKKGAMKMMKKVAKKK